MLALLSRMRQWVRARLLESWDGVRLAFDDLDSFVNTVFSHQRFVVLLYGYRYH